MQTLIQKLPLQKVNWCLKQKQQSTLTTFAEVKHMTATPQKKGKSHLSAEEPPVDKSQSP